MASEVPLHTARDLSLHDVLHTSLAAVQLAVQVCPATSGMGVHDSFVDCTHSGHMVTAFCCNRLSSHGWVPLYSLY